MTALDSADLIDIHTHYQPPGWIRPGGDTSGAVGPEVLQDIDGLIAESNANGVSLRALNAPGESLFGPATDQTDVMDPSKISAVNEFLAETVEAHPGNFVGLATIDGYADDAGAEQTRYAIEELGLQGIVLDSSRYDRYLGSPEAYPTLELAAQLRVPVFVHPVGAPQADRLREVAGRSGNSVGRGLQNAVTILSAIDAGLPEKLPDLHIVFTTLGHASLLYAGDSLAEFKQAHGQAANIYIDTMRFNAPLVRYYGDVLGPDRIIVGSDWPIHRDASRAHVDATLTAAGFSPADQELIRVGNARRLFQLRAAMLGTAA